MKKHFILFQLALCCSFSYSQTFIREIVPFSNQYITFAKGIDCPNGNYLIAMDARAGNLNSTVLVMLNPAGDTIWTRQIDSTSIINIEWRGNLATTFDGGCVLMSQGWDFQGGYFHLTRLDSSGNHLWSKKYQIANSISNVDTLLGVIQTQDSGFVFMGRTGWQFNNNGYSLIKINSIGDTLWTRRYILLNDEYIEFAESSDGGFYIVGWDGLSGVFTKTDLNGNLLWSKKYSLVTNQIALNKIVNVRNDTILIEIGFYGGRNGLIALTDTGDVIGAVRIDSLYKFASSFKCLDGNILVVKVTGQLIMLDPQMNFLWSRSFSVNSWNSMYSSAMGISKKSDGRIWITGHFNSAVSEGMSFISTDSSGYAPCFSFNDSSIIPPLTLTVTSLPTYSESLIPFQISSYFPSISSGVTVNELCNVKSTELKSDLLVSIYPNPAESQITIESNESIIKYVTFFNLIGETQLVSNPTSYMNKINVDVSLMPAGIYFLKAETEKGTTVQKFIKQ